MTDNRDRTPTSYAGRADYFRQQAEEHRRAGQQNRVRECERFAQRCELLTTRDHMEQLTPAER